jgi:hypothetical protein
MVRSKSLLSSSQEKVSAHLDIYSREITVKRRFFREKTNRACELKGNMPVDFPIGNQPEKKKPSKHQFNLYRDAARKSAMDGYPSISSQLSEKSQAVKRLKIF